MDKNAKQNLFIMIVGVLLFALVMNFSTFLKAMGNVVSIVLPIFIGGGLALFLNVPVSYAERRLDNYFSKRKKRPSKQMIRSAAFLITFAVICLVVVLVVTIVFPGIKSSAKSLYVALEKQIPVWIEFLKTHNIDAQWLEEFLAGLNFEKMSHDITSQVGKLFISLFGTVSSVIGILATVGFGMVIAFYMVIDKRNICRHARRLVYAYVKPSWADRLSYFANKFSHTFSKFFVSQCGEAVILGVLMAIALAIFKIPYAQMAGMLTAVCAIIPYIGAFLSCAISVFLSFVVDPLIAVRCLMVYLAVQFIEGQFIYPRVVGGSIGMPPLYTLVAAMIGGKLFGIPGILFFIPLATVIFDLVKEDSRKRLDKSGLQKVDLGETI